MKQLYKASALFLILGLFPYSTELYQSSDTLSAATQNHLDDSNDDLEIETVPLTFDWLRFGFDPRGPVFAKQGTTSLFSYSLEAGVGYRSDNYHWLIMNKDEPQVTVINEKIKRTDTVQGILQAKMYIGNLFVSFLGDWGYICSGKQTARFTQPAEEVTPYADFHSGVDGHVEDYIATLGYYLKIYSGKQNRFYLAPQAGYQWNFQHFKVVHTKPKSALATPSNIDIDNVSDIHFTYNSSNPKVKWNGPFVGLSILCQLQRFDLELGGTYQWLEESFSNRLNVKTTANISGLQFTDSTVAKPSGGFHTRYAYSGMLKLNYHLTSHWLIGLRGSYQQAKTDTSTIMASLKTTTTVDSGPSFGIPVTTVEEIRAPVKSNNRWESWSASVTAGYIF